MSNEHYDTIVVGAGLAGLASALYLARAGQRVLILEKSKQIGGLAMTTRQGEFAFNLGAHAVYRAGQAIDVLRELDIAFTGKVPTPPAGGYGWLGNELHALPVSVPGLLNSGLLDASSKRGYIGLISRLVLTKPDNVRHLTAQQWIDKTVSNPRLRQFMFMMIRLVTYSNAPDELSAAAAVRQLQRGITANVLYLDGGWQSLVDGLYHGAQRAEAQLQTQARISHIDARSQGVTAYLADGQLMNADQIVLAVPLGTAAKLLPNMPAIQQRAQGSLSAMASVYDVALSHLPDNQHTFMLGMDEPVYVQVHSLYADLAPADGTLIQTLYYRRPDEQRTDHEIKAVLQAALDKAQPGWRNYLLHEQYLPHIQVASDMPQPNVKAHGSDVPGLPNVFVAGDWTNDEVLADGSLSSARDVARAIMQRARLHAA